MKPKFFLVITVLIVIDVITHFGCSYTLEGMGIVCSIAPTFCGYPPHHYSERYPELSHTIGKPIPEDDVSSVALPTRYNVRVIDGVQIITIPDSIWLKDFVDDDQK